MEASIQVPRMILAMQTSTLITDHFLFVKSSCQLCANRTHYLFFIQKRTRTELQERSFRFLLTTNKSSLYPTDREKESKEDNNVAGVSKSQRKKQVENGAKCDQ